MDEPAETAELLAFIRTVDTKSLSRAARELSIPRATISRRLARLEERLGVRLLQRTTRSLSLTDAGEAFYGNARLALDAIAQAEDSVRQRDDVVRGPLRVSLPPIQDESFFRLLGDFARRYPEVHLQLHFSTQHVDLLRGGYHVALRAGAELEPGLIARTLMRTPLLCVASPAYLAEHGTPRRPQDLRDHACLVAFARGESPQTHWPLRRGGKVAITPRVATNEVRLLADAAVQGLGIAFMALQLVAQELRSGKLVPVLHDVVGAESLLALVYLEREFLPAQVRAFIEAVAAWAPVHLGKDFVDECAAHTPKVGPKTKAPAKRRASSKSAKKPR